MPRKVFPNSEKVKLVLSSFRDSVIITKFCLDHGIPRSTFYRWRKLILTYLSTMMFDNKRSPLGKRMAHPVKQSVTYKKPHYRCRIK